MAVNQSRLKKKHTLVLLSLLLLFILVTILFGPRQLTQSCWVYGAEQSKNDVNQPADGTSSDPNSKEQPPKDKKVPRPRHSHPAFEQRGKERARMVLTQISRRDVRDPNVLDSLRTVPRHVFVRRADLRRAYNDNPLPIGLGQTISQPYIVGYMTELLKLDPNCKVLEIGTGSGYQAAVCAEIAGEVYTIEIIEELAASASKRLKELGYENIIVKAADGYFGWEEEGPFDTIIVTCAAGFVPPPLIEQLAAGGRMILPLGSPFGAQTLILITKDQEGKVRSKRLLPVRFVPMLGRITKDER